MDENKPCNIERTRNDEDYSAEWEEAQIEDKLNSRLFRAEVPKWASLTKPVVELVANLCKELQYSPEIEFTAYNTLDMFFAKNFSRITAQNQRQFDFPPTEQEVLLNVFNVVMICAKYSSQYAIIPLEKIVSMLQKMGCQCDVGMLKKYEFYFFSTIDFEIYPPVAFQAVNFIVRSVFHGNDAMIIRLMDVCVLLMRFAFLERETIEKKVKEIGIDLCNNIERDECFLAAIVLITGAKIVKLNENDYFLLIEALHLHLHILKKEVLRFSSVLFELVINENKNNYLSQM